MQLSRIRNTVKSVVPTPLKEKAKNIVCPRDPWDQYGRLSFSQEGEDLILARIFAGQKSGFYVDVGAHHPWRYSNTFLFYRRGWRGINIDPRPGMQGLFSEARPEDINLGIAISDHEAELEYFEFNAPELNGFSQEAPVALKHPSRYFLTGSRMVPARPLGSVLADHLPAETEIDFLTVDVEGHDQVVLASNDWTRFRPKVVVAECRGSSLTADSNDPVIDLLKNTGYRPFSKAFHSWIFLRDGFEV